MLLVLAACVSLATESPVGAQALPTGENTEATPAKADAAVNINEIDMTGVDIRNLDWSQLNVDASTLIDPKAKARAASQPGSGSDMSWSSNARPNGASALSVKQPVSSFWDARIGADMTVINQPQALTSADLVRQKFSSDSQPSQSTGTAWAAITAPGVGSIWDKTAVEARVDPAQDQTRLGTSLSKSLPLSEQYSVTLQNGYNVIQQGTAAVPGLSGHATRNYEVDRSAKLSITETGTSFIAGESLSSIDDKWLRKIGAEQKLFGGVTINGSIGETALGTSNKSLTAGFKRSW